MKKSKAIITFAAAMVLLLLSGCGKPDAGSEVSYNTTETTGSVTTDELISQNPADHYGKLVDESMKSKAYTVSYLENGEWVEFDAMSINTMNWSGWETESSIAAYAGFKTEKDELRLRIRRAGTKSWTVRPAENVTDVTENGSTIEFTIKKGSHISLEPGNDRTKNLLIRVTEPVDTSYTGNVECTNVIRLGPGVHTFENCDMIWLTSGMPTFRLKSGDHLILEEGAVLRAKVVADKAENIAITGTGIIDLTEWNGAEANSPYRSDAIRFDNCSNIYVGNITVRNSAFFCLRGIAVKDIHVNGFTAFSGVFEGDGIDFHGAIGAKLENCFLRNSDDCIALYPSMTDIRDIEVLNCVLWSDRAHTINIGTHGSGKPDDRHYIENVSFNGISVIECNCPSEDYQGVIGISLADESICRDLKFENFVIDDFTASQVFLIKIMKLEPWNDTPGYLIDGVLLKNIAYTGSNSRGSTVIGYDAERVTKNILIEDLFINGKKMTSLDEAGIKTNEFTSDIVIK